MTPEPRFACDVMLGRLAQWLRLLGYDTYYAPDVSDAALLRVSDAEERVLLTCDAELAARTRHGYAVRTEGLDDRLAELAQEFGVREHLDASRCTQCNCVVERREKAQVEGKVPPYVLKTASHFRECPGCGRVYWRGSHWKGIEERLRRLE